MKQTITALVLLGLPLGALLPLVGCQTETQTETHADGTVDRDIEVTLDDEAAAEAADDLEAAGAVVGDAAQEAGEAVLDAADQAEDVIDRNVDLGSDAENQGD